MLTKVCNKCKEEKNISDFGLDKKAKDGARTICKSCCALQAKKWANNPEVRLKNAITKKRWRAKNPHKVRETQERWRAKNPEAGRKARKKWCEKHPDRVVASIMKKKKERIKNANLYSSMFDHNIDKVPSNYDGDDSEKSIINSFEKLLDRY